MISNACLPITSGCDGDRLYFDGCCLIALNDSFVAQGSQFTLQEVEITVATVDLDDVLSYRGAIGSRGPQSASSHAYPRCHIDINVCNVNSSSNYSISVPISLHYYMPEEEIMLGKERESK